MSRPCIGGEEKRDFGKEEGAGEQQGETANAAESSGKQRNNTLNSLAQHTARLKKVTNVLTLLYWNSEEKFSLS